VVALAWLAGIPAFALAATGTHSPCATDARDLTSLDVPGTELTIRKIDHESGDADLSGLEPIDTAIEATDAGAPVLNLTPRVANILRDIFRTQNDAPANTDLGGTVPSSPVADSVDDADVPESDKKLPSATGSDQGILPSFQQRMYRKDI
jgi:hypothetical protein